MILELLMLDLDVCMRSKSKLTFLIKGIVCLCFSCGVTQAQVISYEYWPELSLTTKPFKRFTFRGDAFITRTETFPDNYLSQTGYKFWVSYIYKPRVTTSIYWETLHNLQVEEIGSRRYNEHRLVGQINYLKPFHKWTLSNRFRLEDRWIENKEGEFVNVLRLRYRLYGMIPINNTAQMKGTFFVTTSTEIFLNSGSSITGYNVFDRDVSQLGLGYCITDNINLELIYYYTYRIQSDARTQESIHAISMSLSINNIFSRKFIRGFF